MRDGRSWLTAVGNMAVLNGITSEEANKSLVRDSAGNMVSEASRIAVLSSISRSLATSVGK